MKKIYNYENCEVVIHIPDDDQFQERLSRASEKFMRKVMSEGKKNGNSNSSANFRKK